MKKFVPYFGVMLLLVSKPSTNDYPNILYLEIFGLVRAVVEGGWQ